MARQACKLPSVWVASAQGLLRCSARSIDGGGGTSNTASYSASDLGVTVSLMAGATNTGGHAQGDVLSNIHNLIDRLVFLYALATSKAHYRHPDAQPAAVTFQNMLTKEKMKQKENRRFFANTNTARGESQVVRTANGGYTLRS